MLDLYSVLVVLLSLQLLIGSQQVYLMSLLHLNSLVIPTDLYGELLLEQVDYSV